MSTEIVIKNLNQFYGKKQALNNINLTIGNGMFGLLGRNGAGKTTLMKVLATLLPVTEGVVNVCGVPITKEAEIRKITGYLPQDFSMYANMTVYEAMDYLGVLSGLTKKERKDRIPDLLEKVNLQGNKKTKVKALSGGMRRRLGIAQAILHNPKVLIVDEPTAGLDPEERVRFRNLLSEIAQDRIVILSTHIVGDVEATCENIAVLEDGNIIYYGSVTAMLEAARGRIYTADINKMELAHMKEQYPITSMLTQGNTITVRFIAKQKPFENSIPCEANVEDAYMYLLKEKRGELSCS